MKVELRKPILKYGRNLLRQVHKGIGRASLIGDSPFFLCLRARCSVKRRAAPASPRPAQDDPGAQTAFFSILSPGMHILAHRGPYKDVIRCHLVLIVPEPNCRIRVADTIAHREEGKTMFFNDTYEHEVWNGTEGVIKAITASPFITDAKRDLWR